MFIVLAIGSILIPSSHLLGILERLVGGVDWIQLAHDRNRWRAVVNSVMNLQFLAPRSLFYDAFSATNIVKRRMKDDR
jgi:hypothetical protein